jgi:hypothetical protein
MDGWFYATHLTFLFLLIISNKQLLHYLINLICSTLIALFRYFPNTYRDEIF